MKLTISMDVDCSGEAQGDRYVQAQNIVRQLADYHTKTYKDKWLFYAATPSLLTGIKLQPDIGKQPINHKNVCSSNITKILRFYPGRLIHAAYVYM